MENRGTKGTSGIGNATTNKYTNQNASRVDVTSAVNFVYNKINTFALKARQKTDVLLGFLGAVTVDEFCTFTGRNYIHRKLLMDLNDKEIAITLASLGVDAPENGDSTKVTHNILSPSYAAKRNYLDKFQRDIVRAEKSGEITTKRVRENKQNNYTNHGQLYRSTENLYYDDSNTGNIETWSDKENLDTLLNKTRQLFHNNKINTIISRFHTRRDMMKNGENGSEYGLSHGRNLLTKSAENGSGGYNIHGYDNPYCRVWTHHSQYRRFSDAIRPFKEEIDADFEDFDSWPTMDIAEFHRWGAFSAKNESGFTEDYWKTDKNNGWKHTVLDSETGMPNITPRRGDGSTTKLHTKDCMFSIENLAWKGYDPYSFERALSWEQRGPNGGRIMWFPPYGIQFTETSSAKWNEHTFIGRGEPVFTYVNSARQGTLRFMMVVDHPSVVDYVSWDEANASQVKDTDLLRFFAGCENLRYYAKPTPLTDEYINTAVKGIKPEEVKPPTPPAPEEIPEEHPVDVVFYVFFPNNYSGYYDTPGSTVEAMAYLLAGVGAQKKGGNNTNWKTDDIAISFKNLTNAISPRGYEMKEEGGLGDFSTTSDTSEDGMSGNFIAGTSPNWRVMGNRSTYLASGYQGLRGAKKLWCYRIDGKYENAQGKEREINTYDQTLADRSNYKDTNSYGANWDFSQVGVWFKHNTDDPLTQEAVDGMDEILFSFAEFAAVVSNDDAIVDTISTKLAPELSNYFTIKDKSENQNSSTLNPGDILPDDVSGGDINMASIMPMNDTHTATEPTDNSTQDETDSGTNNNKSKQHFEGFRVDKLWQMLYGDAKDDYEITSMKFEGYSNSHGSQRTDGNIEVDLIEGGTKKMSIGDARNYNLARYRAESVKKWLVDTIGGKFANVSDSNVTIAATPSHPVDDKDKTNHCGETAKQWRSVKVTISFAKTSQQNTNEVEVPQENIPADSSPHKEFIGWDYDEFLSKIYKLPVYHYSGNYPASSIELSELWYYNESAQELRLLSEKDREVCEERTVVVNGMGTKNMARYDQEYHFFKKLQSSDPVVFDSLMKKLQYFDPAFHSMTPEGFSARLTFLQQCLRQGNTYSTSDVNSTGNGDESSQYGTANNLAFGMQPYCVLRLGDFLNQMIVIKDISINYDPLVWDTNIEGVGVIPLLCEVNLSFNFIGGADIAGCVRRLQNAMSFNYYANTSLYDNRADRVNPQWSDKTNGAITHGELEKNGNYFYNTPMYKKIN